MLSNWTDVICYAISHGAQTDVFQTAMAFANRRFSVVDTLLFSLIQETSEMQFNTILRNILPLSVDEENELMTRACELNIFPIVYLVLRVSQTLTQQRVIKFAKLAILNKNSQIALVLLKSFVIENGDEIIKQAIDSNDMINFQECLNTGMAVNIAGLLEHALVANNAEMADALTRKGANGANALLSLASMPVEHAQAIKLCLDVCDIDSKKPIEQAAVIVARKGWIHAVIACIRKGARNHDEIIGAARQAGQDELVRIMVNAMSCAT